MAKLKELYEQLVEYAVLANASGWDWNEIDLDKEAAPVELTQSEKSVIIAEAQMRSKAPYQHRYTIFIDSNLVEAEMGTPVVTDAAKENIQIAALARAVEYIETTYGVCAVEVAIDGTRWVVRQNLEPRNCVTLI